MAVALFPGMFPDDRPALAVRFACRDGVRDVMLVRGPRLMRMGMIVRWPMRALVEISAKRRGIVARWPVRWRFAQFGSGERTTDQAELLWHEPSRGLRQDVALDDLHVLEEQPLVELRERELFFVAVVAQSSDRCGELTQ